MKIIKILISSRPKLLSDVIRNLVEHQSDMEITGEVVDPIQLLKIARQTLVDAVIITPLKANGEPKICQQLLAEHPGIKIIAITEKGEAARLYQFGVPMRRMSEPSEHSILDAIREAVLPAV
jgi:DNA-binding NarL/FixJ family response regulator